MRNVIGLITGMVLLVVGVQGAIRLLIDHENTGIFDWVPGGFAARLAVNLVVAVVGGLLAGASRTKANSER